MNAADVLRLVSGALQDLEPGQEKRWKWEGGENDGVGLLDFLNLAVRTVALHRPDATAVTEIILLEPGMRQRLPHRNIHRCRHDALTLIELVRNMGEDGESPGSAIMMVDQGLLLAWGALGKAGVRVDNYACDRLLNPDVFWVYPAVSAVKDLWVEATFSAEPKIVRHPEEMLPLADNYSPALVHHILTSVFSGDNESGNSAKAAYHMQMFQSLLGLKQQVDAAWPRQGGS